MFSLLSDSWDFQNGNWMGKDFNTFEYLTKLYKMDLQEAQTVHYWSKIYEEIVLSHRMEEAGKKRKAEEKKAKRSSGGGGKNYAYNVNG